MKGSTLKPATYNKKVMAEVKALARKQQKVYKTARKTLPKP